MKITLHSTHLIVLTAAVTAAAIMPCGAKEPKPYGPLPTKAQLSWHEMEYYGFTHFSTNTFTDRQWGYGDEQPSVFNPTDFDADQIIRTAAESGMKGMILTTKHHDGFCLWPSKYTGHSVKNSPWKNGKGDVVREFADACKKHGIKFGVYISPWDRNHPEYGKPGYITYYRNQIAELLTNYGPIFEIWFDGANGGDGYYGGAKETRVIDRNTYYEWSGTLALIYKLQPNIMIMSDLGPGVRWVGNEGGWANDPCWQTFTPKYRGTENVVEINPQTGLYDQMPIGNSNYLESTTGHRNGKYWMPAEACTPMRTGWFYQKAHDGQTRSPDELLKIYYQTVGRGASLLLNVSPDMRGQLPDEDVRILREFGKIQNQTFKVDLAKGARVSASNTRASGNFSPANVTDNKRQTYWTCDDQVTRPELLLEFKAPITFNVVSLREYLPLGQRVDTWALDQIKDGQWQEFAKGESIGSRHLWRGPSITSAKVRLRLTGPVCPALAEVALFAEPVRLVVPKISRDPQGLVSLDGGSPSADVRYTLDGTEPGLVSPAFIQPFPLAHGGIVKARVVNTKDKAMSDVAGVSFGMAKTKWKIATVSYTTLGGGEAERAIDDKPETIWHTYGPDGEHTLPQEIVVDMNEEIEVKAFTYLPRQDGVTVNGMVDKYQFYLSADGKTWTTPAAEGEFGNIATSPILQTITLTTPAKARFFKFVATHAVACNHAVVAELGIIGR